MSAATPKPTAIASMSVTLDRGEPKKHSVRFDAALPESGPKPALTAIYLMNEADEAFGHPESVVITITAEPTS